MSSKNFKYIYLFLTILLVLVGIGGLSAANTGDNTAICDIAGVQADTVSTKNDIETLSEQSMVSDQSISMKKISETKAVNKKKISTTAKQKQAVKTNTTKVIKKETNTTVNNYDELVNTINTAKDDKLTINLNKGTYTSTGTIILNTQTAKDITMNGNGQKIDANGQQFLNITNGYAFTLKDLTITNAKAEQGGAIEDRGNLTLINVTFNNNTAEYDGGAVYIADNGKATIDNTNFFNSTAKRGGAVYIEKSEAAINNSNFTESTANDFGLGGAVYIEKGKAAINNSNFIKNTAKNDFGFGGAIFIMQSESAIINSNFTENMAKNDLSLGGAVYVSKSNATINSSNFNNNTAGGSGGAVYIEKGEAAINNSNFTENNATCGGAVCIADNDKVTIISSNFNNNTAGGSGGAVDVNKSDAAIISSNFNNNTARTAGAVCIYNSNISINSSNFIKNKVDNFFHGGAVTIGGNGKTTISKSNFTENNTTYGGAVSAVNCNTSIDSSGFNNNTAEQDGGAIYVFKSNMSINSSDFDNNNALRGGAINNYGSDLVINYTTLINNSAAIGGAIFIDDDAGTLLIGNSTLLNNIQNEFNQIYNYPKNNNIKVENITVNKIDTQVTVDPINAMLNDNVSFIAHVLDTEGNNVTGGYVLFKVNNVTIKDAEGNPVHVDVTDGTAILNTTATWTKADTTQVVYSGSDIYKSARNNGTISVAKHNATVTLTVTSTNLKPGENLIATAKITDAEGNPVTNGSVIFKLNGKTLTDKNGMQLRFNVINGTVTLNYTIPENYSVKTYILSAVFGGSIYNRAEAAANVTLNKIDSYIQVNNITITGNQLHLNATIRNKNTKKLASEKTTRVSVKVDKHTIIRDVTVTGGVINLNETVNLTDGNHTVEIITSGNSKYNPTRYNTTIITKSQLNRNTTVTDNQTMIEA